MNFSTIANFCEEALCRLSDHDSLPVVYFDGLPNIGDLLNLYMLPKIANRNIRRAKTVHLPHLSGIGSTLNVATRMSTIWGAGSIDGLPKRLNIRPNQVHALRGECTLQLLKNKYALNDIPLGDPAVLLPQFYKASQMDQFGLIGVVPHFRETKIVSRLLEESKARNVRIIDVRLQPERFVDQLCECSAILSSSLHGLILADAYGIPNAWISFSENLIGGKWKFHDYYSTTSNPGAGRRDIKDFSDWQNTIRKIDKIVTISRYMEDAQKLRDAFPKELIRNDLLVE